MLGGLFIGDKAMALITRAQQRANTIRYAVPNLRYRWPSELAAFTDNQIAACFEDFGLSEDYGDNDAKFPEWFEMIGGYPSEGF